MSLQSTPSQTVGPYYSIGLAPLYATQLANDETRGERIAVHGIVHDGFGRPVGDAVLEIWQADAAGIYAHPADPRNAQRDPAFDGWGRVPTDASGAFAFTTIRPGAVAGPDGAPQAPHLVVLVFMRGLLRAAPTRLYFPESFSGDAILDAVPAARRATLVATSDGPGRYRWDVHMQGERETVFFDY